MGTMKPVPILPKLRSFVSFFFPPPVPRLRTQAFSASAAHSSLRVLDPTAGLSVVITGKRLTSHLNGQTPMVTRASETVTSNQLGR